MTNKTCVDCLFPLSTECFYNRKASPDGKYSCCKKCFDIRNRKYFEKHRNKRLEWKRKHRIKNSEKLLQYQREYVSKNKEKIREYQRQRRRTWVKTDKFRKRRQEDKRIHRAKKYGNGGRHNEQEWENLLKICNYQCVSCGSKDNIQRDHIVPLSRGGSDDITNIQPLCKPCNASKGKWHATDYRKKELLPIIKEIGIKKCAYCEISFKPLNSKKIYCSYRCKQRKRREKKFLLAITKYHIP